MENKTQKSVNAGNSVKGGPGSMRMGRGAPQKAKNFKKAWGRLLRFCKPYYLITSLAFLFAIAATVFQLIGPRKLGDMFENIFTLDDTDKAFAIGRFLIIIYSLFFVLSYAQQFIMATVTQRIAKKLRSNISVKINRLPFDYYDKTNTGDILSRITNDVDMVSSTLNQSVVTLISQLTLLIGSVVFMFVTNWILAFVAIGASLGGFVLMALIMAKSQKYFVSQQKSLGDLNGHIEEYYSGHNVVKASNANGQINAQFSEINRELFKSGWKSNFFSGLMMPLMGFVSQLSFVLVMAVGGILAFNGTIGFAVIISFMLYVRFFTNTLGQLAQAMQNMQSTAASSERVFEFLDEKEMEDESALTKHLETIRGDVKFENVRFGYEKDKPVIKNFNAVIKHGSKVAIVGPTGAGKTTIVNLLMKFYDLEQPAAKEHMAEPRSGDTPYPSAQIHGGQITIDGISLSELKRDNVHRLFGMVLQDTWLFEGTVRENLVYNMKDISDERLDEACKAVGIDHFIRTLPNGYDTVLNESASVSNGQKQLLTIARAMIKDAPLLILDEATSSVDTRTELQIQQAMDKLTKGRTSFVIAHRLSTIKNADIILVMKEGDIVEQGTHDVLLKKNGFYASLYNSQFTQAEEL